MKKFKKSYKILYKFRIILHNCLVKEKEAQKTKNFSFLNKSFVQQSQPKHTILETFVFGLKRVRLRDVWPSL